MAEEQKQQKVDETGEPTEQGKKKSISKIIVLLVIFFVLAGGGAAGYFLYGSQIMGKLFHKESPKDGEQAGPKEEDKKREVIGPILSLDPFIFNMSGSQSKYAKVTLGIECKDAKVMEEAKKMMPVIRDKILSIFGTKAPEVLMDVNSRTVIKEEIQKNLKTLFPDGEDLKAVYITDLIIQ